MRNKTDPRMLEAYRLIGDPYMNLGKAIVVQAAKDYLTALRGGYKYRYEAKSIEKFFRSQWYQELTDVNPDWLIERLQDEIRKERRPVR